MISPDIYSTAVELSSARRATLNQQRRKAAAHRLQQCTGLSLGTLSCMPNTAMTCMGGFILYLFFYCLLHKWRKHKGAHPTASRYAAKGATKYCRVQGKIHKIWKKQRHKLEKALFQFELWCIIILFLICLKLSRTLMRCKYKLIQPAFDRIKLIYLKVALFIYSIVPFLRVSAIVIFLKLFLSGDVELNPGPEGQLTIGDLKIVLSEIWDARSKWINIGIQLNLIMTDLEAIKEANSSDIGKCFTDMLTLWLKQVNPPPTWSTLVTALKEPPVGLEHLSEVVAKKHICKDSNGISAEVAKLSFPHIKCVAPNERTRLELEQRLRMESKDIIMEFRILRNKFFVSLEKQEIPIKTLCRFLREELQDCIDTKVATFEDVLDFIEKKSTFYDYQLVKYLIKLTGAEVDKQLLKNYEMEFSHYAQRRIYECPETLVHDSPGLKGSDADSSSQLHIKLDSIYDQCTLQELKELQLRLCSILHLSIYVCRLKDVKQGCFMLTFIIPHCVQENIFPLTVQQKLSLSLMGVLQLICDDYRFGEGHILREILDLTWNYRAGWRLLGVELGLNIDILYAISENMKTTADCLAAVIKHCDTSKSATIKAFLSQRIASAIKALSDTTDYKEYASYLKYIYKINSQTTSHDQWPPPPTKKFFRLAMVESLQLQNTKTDDDFVLMTITGKVDDILHHKTPIELKDIFIKTKRQRKKVLIEGAPGCGKSTLSMHICQQWAEGQLFQEYELVILVKLRDPIVQHCKSIADLLPRCDEAMGKDIEELLTRTKGRNVLFIIDGWDELPQSAPGYSFMLKFIQAESNDRLHSDSNSDEGDSRCESESDRDGVETGVDESKLVKAGVDESESDREDIETEVKVPQSSGGLDDRCESESDEDRCGSESDKISETEDRLLDIGQILDNSSIIITSRPTRSAILHPLVSTRIEILGFTKHELRQYFTGCLHEDTEAVEKLLQKIKENPMVEGSCYLPLNASILVHLFISEGNVFPTTQIGIISALICNCISRHLMKSTHKVCVVESLEKLPLIAIDPFERLCELAYNGVMNGKVIFELDSSFNTLGLLQGVESFAIHGSSHSYNFLHLSIQELLAATYIVTKQKANEHADQFKKLYNHQSHFRSVLLFYAAKTKLQAPWISEVVIQAAISDKHGLLSSLHCLFEAQDFNLYQALADQLNSRLDLGNISLNLPDNFVISFFLAHPGVHLVFLNGCGIGDDGCNILFRRNKSYYFRSLSLYNNFIGFEGAVAISVAVKTNANLQQLNLDNNSLGDEGAVVIAEALETIINFQELHLNYNCIGVRGALAIAKALKTMINFQILSLDSNSIGNEGAVAIAEALKMMTNLQKLFLSNNTIGDVGAVAISEALKTITGFRTLFLSRNYIGDEGAVAIAQTLRTMTNFQTLSLNNNSIDKVGIQALSAAAKLTNVKNIFLGNQRQDDSDIKHKVTFTFVL